jgi:hypothetical protein
VGGRCQGACAGQDIFFRRGEYDPASLEGREVLAHELVHVVQQTGASSGGGDGASLLVQRGRKKKPGQTKSSQKQQKTKKTKKPKRRLDSSEDDQSSYEDEDLSYEDLSYEESSSHSASSSGEGLKEKPTSRKRSRSLNADVEEPVRKRFVRRKSKDVAKADTDQPTATADIPDGYLGLEAMKRYLADAGLVPGQDPEPVSVGVVVWNINHLKADDDDDVDVDVQGQDVMSVEYDTKAIIAAMAQLKQVLDEVAGPLGAAIAKELERLEAEEDAHKDTRREVSQLDRDIYEFQRLNLDDVLTPAIEAMTERARDGGKSGIEARAGQLEKIRPLARVSKRLERLRAVLFGKAKLNEKVAVRGRIRKALAPAQAERIRKAIEAILAQSPFGELEGAVTGLKQGTVLDLATETFFKNPAVNLVLINEMNLGITQLRVAVEKTAGQVGLSTGPMMAAKGKLADEDAEQQQVVGKQYEYYPALHRAGAHGVTPMGTFYVDTRSGDFVVQEEDQDDVIGWDKAEKTFRGIVVHRYRQGEQEFWAGILHTTPAGKDLNRVNIWPQIRDPLAQLNKLALYFKIPLLVGGDFYIPPEGIVNKATPAQKAAYLKDNPGWFGKVKSWNFARNIFTTVEAQDRPRRGAVEKLIASVAPSSGLSKTARIKASKPGGHSRRAAEPEDDWDRYRKAVAPQVAKLAASDKPKLTNALKLLAPGMNIEVDWKSTVAAGTIGERDISRNYRWPKGSGRKGEEPRFTMQRALQPMGYRIVEAGSPTNPKEHGRGENKMQLADLFLVNEYWHTTRSGIVTPGTAQLKPVDDLALSATRTYWKISDHSPVLMLGSTEAYDIGPHSAFDMGPTAAMKAVKANQAEWESIGRDLAGVKTTGVPVADQVKVIKEILEHPIAGPSSIVLALRDVVRGLDDSITDVPGRNMLTPTQNKALKRLQRWRHPIYTTEFGEEAPAGSPGKASGQGPAPGLIPSPGANPLAPPGHGAAEQRPQVAGPSAQLAWPTGQMVNVSNSCYLAAVIHVLASHQVFSDVLDPQKNTPPSTAGGNLQTALANLVTRLQNPQNTISAADMRAFMRTLDDLGGVLASEPTSATTWQPPSEPTKPLPGTKKPQAEIPKTSGKPKTSAKQTPVHRAVEPALGLPTAAKVLTAAKATKSNPVKQTVSRLPVQLPQKQTKPSIPLNRPASKGVPGKPTAAPQKPTAAPRKPVAAPPKSSISPQHTVPKQTSGRPSILPPGKLPLKKAASKQSLSTQPPATPSPKQTDLPLTTSTAVTKEATEMAVEATEKRKAFGIQQDASEVLLNVLDLLRPPDITLGPTNPANEMLSKSTSLLKPAGGELTTNVAPFSPIVPLMIGPGVTSIAQALKVYSAIETTDYGAKKRTLFTKLPNVLILSLGRFDHLGKKITKQVEATDPLQIPDECLTTALKYSLQGNQPTYRLLHVVHHSGQYIGGGHYTSYARLPGFGAWYKHDDAERAAFRRTAPGPQALQWGLNTGFIYVYVRV